MDMLRYVMIQEKYCMGNCLIKGSQTCSQTCSSLAPLESKCTLESVYISIHFIYKSLLQTYGRLVKTSTHFWVRLEKKHVFSYWRYENTFFKLFFIFSHWMFTLVQGTAHFGVLVFLQQHSNRWQHHYLDKSFSGALQSLTGRGGKRTHILHSSRRTDTVVGKKKKGR